VQIDIAPAPLGVGENERLRDKQRCTPMSIE
jgi:hypothetical protein